MVEQNFIKAAEEVKTLSQKPSNEELLKLYALYKQATEGDVSGKKPSLLDIKGRKKFEAWETVKGMNTETAKSQYCGLVSELKAKLG